MPTEPNGHELRRQRTRAQLIEAARGLIAEHGLPGLKIADIAKRGGVALGSFYNHFASRDELVEAVVEAHLVALATSALAIGDEADPAVVVSVATRRFVRLAYDDPDLARLAVNLNHDNARALRVAAPFAMEALGRGIASGRFEVVDEQVSFALIGGGTLALMHAILSGDTGAQDHADEAFAEAALRSLGVDGEEARAVSRRPLPAD